MNLAIAQTVAVQGARNQTEKKMVDVTLHLRTASHAEVDGSLSSPRRGPSPRWVTEADDKHEWAGQSQNGQTTYVRVSTEANDEEEV